MNDLAFALTRLTHHSKDGAYSTQGERYGTLILLANQLVSLGYYQLTPHDLKLRHADRLVAQWRTDGLTTGTIENRLSVLRWWAEKVGRPSVLPATNDRWQLPPRQAVPTVSKATSAPPETLVLIPDPYIRHAVALQAAFGLRREECLKFQPHWADCGSYVRLKGSWCKGGRYREVPITTPEQCAILEAAQALVPSKTGSMIPPERTYIEQRRRYDALTRRVGLRHLHGLRHAHFQQRFETLTGFKCPVAGGPSWTVMTPEERLRDRMARHQLPAEMGHGRASVCATYFGR
jgi:integrase